MDVDDYTDARTLLPEYEQHRCPDCGTIKWFNYSEPPYDRPYWRCESCSTRLHETLEYPCPECDVRLAFDDELAVCNNAVCENDGVEIDKSGLIDQLSAERDTRGMPRALLGDCPVCGADHSVNGGPDGELVCRECDGFYAGRYSDEWYCYAIWMCDPVQIRVNA